MRTKLRLEPDVAARIEQKIRRIGLRMKKIVNQAPRLGLDRVSSKRVFRVEPHALDFKIGVNHDGMHQLLDELEVEEAVAQLQAKTHRRTDDSSRFQPSDRKIGRHLFGSL